MDPARDLSGWDRVRGSSSDRRINYFWFGNGFRGCRFGSLYLTSITLDACLAPGARDFYGDILPAAAPSLMWRPDEFLWGVDGGTRG